MWLVSLQKGIIRKQRKIGKMVWRDNGIRGPAPESRKGTWDRILPSQLSEGTNPADILTLDCQPPESWDSIFLLFKSILFCYSCTSKRTNPKQRKEVRGIWWIRIKASGWNVESVCVISCVRLFVTLQTIAQQALLSSRFSKQEY